MKKILLSVATLFVALSLTMVSCGNSNEALIDKYEKIVMKMADASSSGDTKKALSLAQEAAKIGKELDERELTKEEKSRVAEISAKAAMKSIPGGFDTSSLDFEELDFSN